MEGRAIARPNVCQHAPRTGRGRPGRRFNGGPSNCPAKPKIARQSAQCQRERLLQWRAEQLPGQTCSSPRGRRPNLFPEVAPLQWRAEQLPGQTSANRFRFRAAGQLASMEGRAIARPNVMNVVVAGAVGRRVASMEGRAIARPNPMRQAALLPAPNTRADAASMEGRAIARPNPPRPENQRRQSLRFNGGPSNCPAKPVPERMCPIIACMLQWRAEQLPGQTRRHPERAAADPLCGFNGGPSNCPAKPPASSPLTHGMTWLQWRAEQLPGQTRSCRRSSVRVHRASMEGRAIARPNHREPFADHRSQLQSFNGGPSNCPAKLAVPVCRPPVNTT